MQLLRFWPLALLLWLALPMGTAYSATIVVDGNPNDWPDAALLTTDPNEGNGGTDIGRVFFTNNTTSLFWRFDTQTATDLSTGSRTVYICMNTDNNASGFAPNNCGGQTGVDYIVEIQEPGVVFLQQCESTNCNGNTIPGAVSNTLNSTTEVRVSPLSALGINTNRTIPSSIAFDAATDDIVSGLSAVIPGPTAVTLASFDAQRSAAGVEVRWVTATEYDAAGFHLYRSSTGQRADAERITPNLIPAMGDGVTGASYAWTDATGASDDAYGYWLEEVDVSGERNEYGPVQIQPVGSARSVLFLPLVVR